MSWYRRDGSDLVLCLRIQPRAGRDAFAEVLDDCRKVRIKAPPVDGKANDHLIRYLAKTFGVPRRAVTIEQGHTSRTKRVRIQGVQVLPPELS